MTTVDIILLALCGINVTVSIVNLTFCITLSRRRVNNPPVPSEMDHFAQLEKRLYDLTNKRFGGTIR